MHSQYSEVSMVDSTLQAARKLFGEHQRQIAEQTDRLFAMLMGFQWLVAIFISLWLSPKTWTDPLSKVHPHVWAALFIGGAISLLAAVLALKRTRATSTRYIIA